MVRAARALMACRKSAALNPPAFIVTTALPDRHYDQEAAAFIESVLGTGEHRDDTDYGVKSTFTAILGREAAYRRQTLEWDALWKAKDKLTMKSAVETVRR